MNWMKLFLDWYSIGEREGIKGGHRKRDVLLEVAVPVMDEVESTEIIESWDHSFQGKKGDLSHGTISILISTREDPEKVKTELRKQLADFEERRHFDFKIGPPKKMIEFWGEKNSTTFAKLRSLSSKLAIESMKGETHSGGGLGKSRVWHVKENRLGHIWLNQLGFNNLQEAILSQRNALLRLNQVIDQMDTEFSEILTSQKELLEKLVTKTEQTWIIADLINNS